MPPHRKTRSLDELLALRQAARAGRAGPSCIATAASTSSTPATSSTCSSPSRWATCWSCRSAPTRTCNKGPDRPLIPDDLRAASVAALECVDHVYVNPDPTAAATSGSPAAGRLRQGPGVREERRPALPGRARGRRAPRRAGRVLQRRGRLLLHRPDRHDGHGGTTAPAFNDEKVSRLRQRHGLSAAHLDDLLHRGRGLRVVVVGDYVLDRYHFCDATGVAGEGPMMSLRALEERDYDGGAGVIALHLAGLGAAPTLVSGFADDDLSRQADLRLKSARRGRAVPARPQVVGRQAPLPRGADQAVQGGRGRSPRPRIRGTRTWWPPASWRRPTGRRRWSSPTSATG